MVPCGSIWDWVTIASASAATAVVIASCTAIGVCACADATVVFTPGEVVVENAGVRPDIEVYNAPHECERGVDMQLTRAIECLLAKLEAAAHTAL